MKNRFLAIAAILLCGQTMLYSQAFTSAVNISGANLLNDEAFDVEVTAFSEKIVACSRTTSAAGTDGYMRVFNSANAPLFEYQIIGSGNDVVYAVDKFTNAATVSDIYLTGYFTGTANVFRRFPMGAPVLITTLTAPSGNATDQTYFVMKVNTSGTYFWTYLAGNVSGTGPETGGDVTVELVNGMRMLYTTGSFSGTTTFSAAPGSITRSSAGTGQDVFVACYTDNGATAALNWVNTAFSPAGANNDFGWGLDADANGIVYVTGSVAAGAATFNSTGGPAQITAAGFGDDDAFVARYTLAGLCSGTRLLGGNGVSGGVADQGRGIAVTSNGSNLYVSGYYRGTGGSFGAATGQSEGFVQYLTAATLTPGWFRTVRSTGFDACYRLCLNTAETYCMVSGNYEGIVTVFDQFNVGMYTEVFCATSIADLDGFVLRLDGGTGNTPVMGRVCGVGGIDLTTGVDASNNNEAVTCGHYTSATLLFEGSAPTLTNASAGNFDAFFAVFTPVSIVRLGQFEETNIQAGVQLYPNPAAGMITLRTETASAETPKQFMLFDLTGRIVLNKPVTQAQQEITLAGMPAGTYVWRLVAASGTTQQGKLVVTE